MLDSVKRAPELETLPFPYNKAAFCKYEPIEKRIDHAKVLIVNETDGNHRESSKQ